MRKQRWDRCAQSALSSSCGAVVCSLSRSPTGTKRDAFGALRRVTATGAVDGKWSRRAAVSVSSGIAIDRDAAYVTQSTTRAVAHEVPLARQKATTKELTTPPEIASGLNDLAVIPQALLMSRRVPTRGAGRFTARARSLSSPSDAPCSKE